MTLRELIIPASSFQTSINLAYDLRDEAKIQAFIPTGASVEVIGDVLSSTHPKSTQRARILIGAYGRGKSHIILVLLALLRKKRTRLFDQVLAKLKEVSPEQARIADDFFNSKRKLLPVIVRGSNTTLSQAFLNALQFSLSDEDLGGLVPETHFQAACSALAKWRSDFPNTFSAFSHKVGQPVEGFLRALGQHDESAYQRFVDLYPSLTSGSIFNPFMGCDVPELYAEVASKVKAEGYEGLFVVYDEFSKYLESGIATSTVSDTKMLQDFAEKCNRSGETPIHLMLICHKDIANYIDGNLPKEKVDGWHGVSGRFLHVNLHNNFSQVYEIIAAVLKKDEKKWARFKKEHQPLFDELKETFTKASLLDAHEAPVVAEDCYPLHPLATFILPRISERIAQNERTLFTFLAANEKKALSAFLDGKHHDFPLLTLDYLYDYFEPLLKKQPQSSGEHKLWRLAESALRRVENNVLGNKIIKVLALIYLVEQFEKLPPTVDVVVNAFYLSDYDRDAVTKALDELRNKDCVVYLKRSNQHLRIKESSGADLQAEVASFVEKHRTALVVADILNRSAFDNCLYPVRYNDENDITRYFDFNFISVEEILAVSDWNARLDATGADGIVYAVLATTEKEAKEVGRMLRGLRDDYPRLLFAVPEHPSSIANSAIEYEAVKLLREQAAEDPVLREEYDIWLDDLSEVVGAFIAGYTRPGTGYVTWWHCGQSSTMSRKSELSEKLSEICDAVYRRTPRINNESINKNTLSTTAKNSRAKVLAGLLANELSPNLGLTGTGQDVSMMRSLLVVPRIVNDPMQPTLNLSPPEENMRYVLTTIRAFFGKAAKAKSAAFSDLYETLTKPEHGIGLKRGIIPVFMAVALHPIKQNLVVLHDGVEMKVTADLLEAINDDPAGYTVLMEDWDKEKADYLSRLEVLFADHIVDAEKNYNAFSYLAYAIMRWYMSLPQYAKSLRVASNRNKAAERFMASLRQRDINPREYLFVTLPSILGKGMSLDEVADQVAEVKRFFDNAVCDLLEDLGKAVKDVFGIIRSRASLASVVKDWHGGLRKETCQRLFEGGENRILDVFASVTSDESDFLQRLARSIAGLRVEDWNSETFESFTQTLRTFKDKIEQFDRERKERSGIGYRLSITGKDGRDVVKTFSKTQTGARAELLRNQITAALSGMGQSISEAEKRQILIEIMEGLC